MLSEKINPARVFDLMLPLDQVAEGYLAMDERRAIKTLLLPQNTEQSTGVKPTGMDKVIVRFQKSWVAISILLTALVSYSVASAQHRASDGTRPDRAKAPRGSAAFALQNGMLVRISEIEIYPADLERYKAILQEEAEASVRLEPGVVSIFPMVEKENPTQVRILEIYASREAYQSHLKTPHFQKYKTSTLKMVKSLRLVDMNAMDAATMTRMFRKMKKR